MDIKSVLKHVSLDDPKTGFDAGCGISSESIEIFLFHDDIAREYLDGMMLPSREDLLGKASFRKAWEKDLEGLGNYACYTGVCALYGRKVLEKQDETGMEVKVYDQIELPLVFTLDSMENGGFQVKGEELKSLW